jgi:hypothetical protein
MSLMSERLEEISHTSAIYKLTAGLPHHPLFRGTHFALKSSETYNLTLGKSRLLGNHCHPSLKPVRPLSILSHFMESLSRILGLAGSRNLQFLVTVYCARHLRTSFKVCNDQGLMLTVHHATTVQTVIKKKKARRDSHIDYRYRTCPETCRKDLAR